MPLKLGKYFVYIALHTLLRDNKKLGTNNNWVLWGCVTTFPLITKPSNMFSSFK